MNDNDTTEDAFESRLCAGLTALVADAEPSPLLARRFHRHLEQGRGPRRPRVRWALAVAAVLALVISVPLLRAAPDQQLAAGDGAALTTSTIQHPGAVAGPTSSTTSVNPPAPVDQGAGWGAKRSQSSSSSPHDHDGWPSPRPSPSSSFSSEPAAMPPPPMPAATAPTAMASQAPSTTVPAPVLSMDVSFDEPLRAGDPVSWRLTVTNHGGPTTLVFKSGKSGEVTLRSQSGAVVYESDKDMAYSQGVREEPLAAGASATYTVSGAPFDVEPGQYLLTAELSSEPGPSPVTRTVTVVP